MADIFSGIIAATKGLNERHRIVLKMVFVDGKTLFQISDALLGAHPQRVRDTLADGCDIIRAGIKSVVSEIFHNEVLRDEIKTLKAQVAVLQSNLAHYEVSSMMVGVEKIRQPFHGDDIPFRLRRVFAELGVTTIAEITGIKRSRLTSWPQVGLRSVRVIDEMLAEHGLKWMPEEYKDAKIGDVIKKGYESLREQNLAEATQK